MSAKMQTAVVTGGASGFGAEVARALHRAGFRVIVTDLDAAAAAALAGSLDPGGETARAEVLDVGRPADLQRVLDGTVARFGSVEVLVNNAARTAAAPLLEIDPAEFNAVMATNAGGTFAGSQIFGRHFKARGTPMVRAVIAPERMAATLAGIPVGHLGDPAFVAELVVLLAGPGAGFVTGACWDANGGLFMR